MQIRHPTGKGSPSKKTLKNTITNPTIQYFISRRMIFNYAII